MRGTAVPGAVTWVLCGGDSVGQQPLPPGTAGRSPALTRPTSTSQGLFLDDGAAPAALPEPPRSGENKVTFLVSFLML